MEVDAMPRSLISLGLASLFCALLAAQESAPREAQLPESRAASEARYTKLGQLPGVQMISRFSDRLYRGSQPQGAQGMEELKKLGISTIISVEEPDQEELDAAKAAGLAVINVPTEYNGFPDKVVQDLLRAYRDLDGTAYVHCHHGKHRGGAAAAIYRMTYEGVQEMAELGASKRYPGLYDTVRRYRPDPATAHRPLKPRPGIDGLIEVTPWILRGTSALAPEAVAALKDLGVRSILSAGMSDEAQGRARAAGLAVTIVPIDLTKPLLEQRQAVVGVLAEKKNEKIFLHAADDPAKVAAMVAFFRLAMSQWSSIEAAKEIEALVSGDAGSVLAGAVRLISPDE
jgi:protein tyrosine phosphatase (PTP) superfamily phosphohydrolase (DUF442 family)